MIYLLIHYNRLLYDSLCILYNIIIIIIIMIYSIIAYCDIIGYNVIFNTEMSFIL